MKPGDISDKLKTTDAARMPNTSDSAKPGRDVLMTEASNPTARM